MKINNTCKVFKLTAIACGCAASFGAFAFDDNIGGVALNVQNKVSFGADWRVTNPSSDLIGISNGGAAYSNNHDDGDLAFGRGQVISSVAKMTSNLTLSKGDFGFFARDSAFFNNNLNNKDFFNPANYSASELAQKNKAVQDEVGRGVDWLDTYFYGNVPLLNRTFSFKIGRQVLNWGESTFVLNGVNSMLALNANRARVPGFELNEVIIPTPMAWASMGLTDNTSLEGFYQLQWQRTEVDADGTFFSTNNFAGSGGTIADLSFGKAPINTPAYTIDKVADHTPPNSGQFGFALRSFLPWLNESDVALYAMNYHSRLPVFSGTSSTLPSPPGTQPLGANFFAEYPKDIHLYGMSFNTSIPWGLALQGEYSFKQGQPIQIDAVELLLTGVGAPSQLDGETFGSSSGNQYIRGWRRHNISQADLGLTKIFGPSTWGGWDQVVALFEAGYMHVHGMEPESVLRYNGPATDLPGNAATAASLGLPQQVGGYATPDSYGYNLLAKFTYNNVFNLVTLEPTIHFTQDVHGISPGPVSDFVQGSKKLELSLGTRFQSNWSTELGYTTFFGGGKNNLLADRDFVDAVVKFAF